MSRLITILITVFTLSSTSSPGVISILKTAFPSRCFALLSAVFRIHTPRLRSLICAFPSPTCPAQIPVEQSIGPCRCHPLQKLETCAPTSQPNHLPCGYRPSLSTAPLSPQPEAEVPVLRILKTTVDALFAL